MNGLIRYQDGNAPNGDQPLAPRAEPSPPAAPPTQKLTTEQQAVMERVQHKANVIRDMAFPAAMAATISVAKDVGPAAFKVYLDRLLQDAGNPTDPVEIVLLEQLALAHHQKIMVKSERCRAFQL